MQDKMIVDRYLLQEERGKGGMGTVYRGLDTQTQNTVAVKLLNPKIANPSMIERFKREGEALRELNHPNIVKLLDAVEQDGQHYLIMEYVDGGDLSHLLENNHLPIQQCLTMALDLADALTRAHKLSIIHRDLKPANILIAGDGTLRLTDFGVAHFLHMERVTDSNAMVGTIDYMPPETFEQKPVDERADVWSFGIILYEMLTRQRPFTGKTIIQVIHQIATEAVPDLEEHRPDAPIPLIDLIYRMLVKDSQQRVPSVRIVGAELEAILKGYEVRDSATVNPDSPLLQVGRFRAPTPATDERKNNLPAETTPFVGRDEELTQLARLIEDDSIRLVTIVAPGGMGKSRLSIETARQHLSYFRDGVYFVELAPIQDAANIVSAVSDALDFQFSRSADDKTELLNFLSNKNMLLVMDNYEHLLDGASLVNDMVKAAPDITVLATSRQRLSQSGETLFHLSGMDFPEWETPEDAMSYAAMKLFMNSALRAKPDFELTEDNLNVVARICRLVQGMPLGIVLSAAWLGMLSPEEIAIEIQQGIDFLEGEGGEIPERQQSIRAVFDYSWQMMSEAEQAIFMKLSIFKGGFTREAAQAVTGAGLRNLMNLVNKSLLYRDSATGRYSIHELLRQYAAEQLQNHGDEATREAHFSYFSQLLIDRYPKFMGASELESYELIDADYENIHAAWDYGVEQGHIDTIDLMTRSFFMYAQARYRQDMFDMQKQALKKLTAQYGEHPSLVFLKLQTIYALYDDKEARCHVVEDALELAREYNRPWDIGQCLRRLCFCYAELDRYEEALQCLKEAESIFRELDEQMFLALVIGNQGDLLVVEGKLEAAKPYFEAHLARYREIDYKAGIPILINDLATVAMETGDIDTYLQLCIEALEIRRAMSFPLGAANMMRNIAMGKWLKGEIEEAHEYYNEALSIFRERNATANLCYHLTHLGQITWLAGQKHLTRQHIAEITSLLKLIPDNKYMQEITKFYHFYYDGNYQSAKVSYLDWFAQLQFNILYIDYLTLRIFAVCLAHTGDSELSVQFMAAIYKTYWITPNYDSTHEYQSWLERVQADLSPEELDAAWQRGTAMDKNDVQQLLDEYLTEDER